MIARLLLAVGCAIAGSMAMLLKQRGAVAAPVVLAGHPLRGAIGLFGSKWWTLGRLMALCAWLLHVGAIVQLTQRAGFRPEPGRPPKRDRAEARRLRQMTQPLRGQPPNRPSGLLPSVLSGDTHQRVGRC